MGDGSEVAAPLLLGEKKGPSVNHLRQHLWCLPRRRLEGGSDHQREHSFPPGPHPTAMSKAPLKGSVRKY